MKKKPIQLVDEDEHEHRFDIKGNVLRDFYLCDLKKSNPKMYKREINDRQRGMRTLKALTDEQFIFLIKERYSNLS